ncbi:magnesium transporter CorA family protein [Kallotenue papyrolyticum]|uniref:magnesium transporter CorA family protein n=1 Tax=Kallotenue papyrolyticum TaxID=1325125 RepID=UPI00047854CB|nr:magnesium transporter CorA family protein [Kallotenue papyrolyticum]
MAVKQLRALRPAPAPALPPPTPRVQTIIHGDLEWIDIQHPTLAEMNELRQRFGFHPLNLEDCLSKVQRPKIDSYPEQGYLFVVLHFPRFNKRTRHSEPAEVDLFVGRGYLITVHDGQLKPLAQLLHAAQTDEALRARLMGRGSGYLLYRVIDRLVDYIFPILGKVDEHIEYIENGIFDRNTRDLVQHLSLVRRDIIALRRIIKPNIPVLRLLTAREWPFLRVDEDIYFGDILDHLDKQWDMLEDAKDIIEGLNSTLDSLTSHRINEVMKILTIISVILLPMTLLASVYGMNVDLPLDEHPAAFSVVVCLMLGAALGMLFFFRIKKWI